MSGIGVIGRDGDGSAPYAYVLGEPARAHRSFEDAAAFLAGKALDAVAVGGPTPVRQAVLSSLSLAFDGTLPPVTFLGADGPLARNLALHEPGSSRLARLLDAWHRDLPFTTRPVDTVRVDGGPIGFFFGTGLVTGFANELSRRRPAAGIAAAFSLVARATASAVVGGPLAHRLHETRRVRVVADRDEWPAERFSAILAGTLPRVAPAFAPFSRAGELPRTFHLIGLACTPRASVGEVLRSLAGRGFSRAHSLDAVAREATLASDRPWRYLLDGVRCEAGETLRLAVGPRLEVVE